MKILVVDDGQLAINSLIRILCRVAPDCDYISAMTTDDALTWMRQGPMDAAYLNLEMPGMNGLALARMIQKLQPRCNIIVVTEHPEYALEALQIFVSGILLKPALSAVLCCIAARMTYRLLFSRFGNGISLLTAIAAGGVVYLTMLFWLKFIKSAEICLAFSGKNKRK